MEEKRCFANTEMNAFYEKVPATVHLNNALFKCILL